MRFARGVRFFDAETQMAGVVLDAKPCGDGWSVLGKLDNQQVIVRPARDLIEAVPQRFKCRLATIDGVPQP